MKLRKIIVRAIRTRVGSFLLGFGSGLLNVPESVLESWMKTARRYDQKGSD